MEDLSFAEDALHVLELAREEAMALRHDWFGTEHLLLGLARALEEGVSGAGVQALRRVLPPDIGAPEIRERVLRLIPPETESSGEEWRIAPRTERVVRRAAKLAADDGDSLVGTQHLVLALFWEPGGVVERVLARPGLNYKLVTNMPRPFAKRRKFGKERAIDDAGLVLFAPEGDHPALGQ